MDQTSPKPLIELFFVLGMIYGGTAGHFLLTVTCFSHFSSPSSSSSSSSECSSKCLIARAGMWGISGLRLQCLVPTWPCSSAHCSIVQRYDRDTKPQWALLKVLLKFGGIARPAEALNVDNAPPALVSSTYTFDSPLTTSPTSTLTACPFCSVLQLKSEGGVVWPQLFSLVVRASTAAIVQRSSSREGQHWLFFNGSFNGDNAFFPCHKADAVLWQRTMASPSETVYHVKGTPGSRCPALCGPFSPATP